MNHFPSSLRGLTLVEILVVLGLFSTIATLALGSLFNAQTINTKLQKSQSILDNVNLSIQTMTRDIRFGSEFYCDSHLPTSTVPSTLRKNCASDTLGGRVLTYRQTEAIHELDRVTYFVSNGVLYKREYPHTGASSTLQMTSNDVYIDSLRFYVDGANSSDGASTTDNLIDYKQPVVTIFISGVTGSSSRSTSRSSFQLETVVSSREPDNK